MSDPRRELADRRRDPGEPAAWTADGTPEAIERELAARERRVLEATPQALGGPRGIDEIVARTRLPAPTIRELLDGLRDRGLVSESALGRWHVTERGLDELGDTGAS